MPTINGIKMACAPCIRGHRSTKCNHSDERLMVPVRKPGRPLSTCPHPQHESCGCGSVTAAIPRKQKCGCGSSSHANGHREHSKDTLENEVTVQSTSPTSAVESEPPKNSAEPSPTIKAPANFRSQKLSKLQTVSQKHPGDSGLADTIEHVKTNIVDVKKAHIRPQPLAPNPEQTKNTREGKSIPWELAGPAVNGFGKAVGGGHLDFNGISPLSNGNTPMLNGGPTTPPIEVESQYGPFVALSSPQQFPGYTRQLHRQPNGVVIETRIHNVGPNGAANLNTQWAMPQYKEELAMPIVSRSVSQTQATNGAQQSCCSAKRKRMPEPSLAAKETSEDGSCCSSKRPKPILHPLPHSMPAQLTPSQSPQLPPLTNHINHVTGTFPSFGYMQHSGLNGIVYPTVFAYPPAYGSYQHPLEPAQWKQGVQYNTYAHLMAVNPTPPSQGQHLEVNTENEIDTLHSCACGDGCECVGCAAHPYNEATQNYVRSAWEMGMEQTTNHHTSQSSNNVSENYQTSTSTATIPNTNGANIKSINTQLDGSIPPISPTAGTPSDTTGDDIPLSASDFFFVNYPFANDGCGGDTLSCPCGDDCACLGCFIHNNPDSLPLAMPDEDEHMNGNDMIARSIKDEQTTPKPKGSCCGGPTPVEEDSDTENGFVNTAILSNYGEICGGDEETCPCPPDGCRCIGCTIHSRA